MEQPEALPVEELPKAAVELQAPALPEAAQEPPEHGMPEALPVEQPEALPLPKAAPELQAPGAEELEEHGVPDALPVENPEEALPEDRPEPPAAEQRIASSILRERAGRQMLETTDIAALKISPGFPQVCTSQSTVCMQSLTS